MADTTDEIKTNDKYMMMAKKRICLALDVSTADEAIKLANELNEYIGICKVGKEIHTAASMSSINIVDRLDNADVNVFLDLKLHDTPNTVYKASIASVFPNVEMFNLHIAGGEEMCKKALDGAKKGYELMLSEYGDTHPMRGYKLQIPKVIGVTVLTSLNDADLATQGMNITYKDLVRKRTELARKWGLDGIVCPANAAGALEKEFGSDFLYVTPGIEWQGVSREGQKQLYTPDLAVTDCSNSILVIGGAILKKPDTIQKQQAAYEILTVISNVLRTQK